MTDDNGATDTIEAPAKPLKWSIAIDQALGELGLDANNAAVQARVCQLRGSDEEPAAGYISTRRMLLRKKASGEVAKPKGKAYMDMKPKVKAYMEVIDCAVEQLIEARRFVAKVGGVEAGVALLKALKKLE